MAKIALLELPGAGAPCKARRGAGGRALFGTALLALSTSAAALPLETVEPRAFGYTVGDVLERRLLVDPSRDGRLDPASLPRPGRYGRWFDLREVTPLPGGVRLLYQIVNLPSQADQENLPSLRVRVIDPDGRTRDADIGPFTVAMAPVANLGRYETIQAVDIRPDRDPGPIDVSGRRARIALYAAALIVLVAAQLAPALARRLGWRRAGPFARALRSLRTRRLRGDHEATRNQALRRLHEALDEAAGRTVALDNVGLLFLVQPWLTPARASIEALLAQSRASFFGQSPPPPSARLVSVAAQLADLERRR